MGRPGVHTGLSSQVEMGSVPLPPLPPPTSTIPSQVGPSLAGATRLPPPHSPPPHKATSQKVNSGEAPGHGPEFLDSAWGGHGPVCRTESPAEPQAPQGQLVWWGTQRDPEKPAGGADNSRRRGQGPVAVRGPGGEVCRPRQRHPDESGGVRRRGRGNRGRPRALLGPLLSPGH